MTMMTTIEDGYMGTFGDGSGIASEKIYPKTKKIQRYPKISMIYGRCPMEEEKSLPYGHNWIVPKSQFQGLETVVQFDLLIQ